MKNEQARFTYINGPTALIEINGLTLLTDPTFDPAGDEYSTSLYTLKKLTHPAIEIEDLGEIDAVLLSHEHHFDNLDRKGRILLARSKKVITTKIAAEKLGGNAVGLSSWESIELKAPDGSSVTVTGTPARHGPKNGDRGPVTGFVLATDKARQNQIYVSGDTVWFEGIEEISRRFNIGIAVLFMGAARVPEVGPDHLTFTAKEGIEAASVFENALIIPLHCEGWRHFSESKQQIQDAFAQAGLKERLIVLKPGRPLAISIE